MIGNNTLRQMKSIVNLKDNFLEAGEIKIPFQYTNDGVEYYLKKNGSASSFVNC